LATPHQITLIYIKPITGSRKNPFNLF